MRNTRKTRRGGNRIKHSAMRNLLPSAQVPYSNGTNRLKRQTASRYLSPKLRFTNEVTVVPVNKVGRRPVGNSSKTSTRSLRRNLNPRMPMRTVRAKENEIVARHVAEVFQRSNSANEMEAYVNSLPIAPHLKNRIEAQFMRNYGNAFNNTPSNTLNLNSFGAPRVEGMYLDSE